jgi:hypothetical protein
MSGVISKEQSQDAELLSADTGLELWFTLCMWYVFSHWKSYLEATSLLASKAPLVFRTEQNGW